MQQPAIAHSDAGRTQTCEARRTTINRVRPRMADNGRGTVLVTDGGSGQGRSALAAVRALDAAGYRAVVGATGPRNMAATSRFCAESVLTPPVSDPGYANSVRASAESLEARLVLASDAALVALDRPEAALRDDYLLKVFDGAAQLTIS